jgi:hypothetical protein
MILVEEIISTLIMAYTSPLKVLIGQEVGLVMWRMTVRLSVKLIAIKFGDLLEQPYYITAPLKPTAQPEYIIFTSTPMQGFACTVDHVQQIKLQALALFYITLQGRQSWWG